MGMCVIAHFGRVLAITAQLLKTLQLAFTDQNTEEMVFYIYGGLCITVELCTKECVLLTTIVQNNYKICGIPHITHVCIKDDIGPGPLPCQCSRGLQRHCTMAPGPVGYSE